MSVPRAFAELELPSLVPAAASPALPEDGSACIAVAAPTSVRVVAGERFVVPLCASYRLPYDYLGVRSGFARALRLLAVDARSGEPLEGPAFEAPGGPRGEEALPGPPSRATYTGHVNVDLATALGLPRTAASYHVCAYLGEHLSNVLRLEVEA